MRLISNLFSGVKLFMYATYIACVFSIPALAEPACYLSQEGEIIDLSHLCLPEESLSEEEEPLLLETMPGQEDFVQGLELYNEGELAAAIRSIDRAIEVNPEQVGYYWLRSVIHAENASFSRGAVADFRALRRAYREDNRNNPDAVTDDELRQIFFPIDSR